ncbi:MAG: glycolate oxidase subunit GlcE [Pseudomonadota bacterium]|jgi:glycolate oxidase FAD binding subunit
MMTEISLAQGGCGLADWRGQLHQAASAGCQILPVGTGSTRHLLEGIFTSKVRELITTTHSGITLYEPGELVLSARAGTPLSLIQQQLAAEGQMLTFEPPIFAPGCTIGGCYSMGTAGPRRMYAGGFREAILGIELMSGRGEVMKFGGRVMKNVAGFDIARALAGTRGAMGLISEITLRVIASPETEATVSVTCTADDAILQMNHLAGTSCPLSASMWHDGRLYLRLSGSVRRVQAATTALGGEKIEGEDSDQLWQSVNHHTMPFFGKAEPDVSLWRLSLPVTTPWRTPAGTYRSMMEWGGGVRWYWSTAPAEDVHTLARSAGGSAWLWRPGTELGKAAATPRQTGAPLPLIRLQQRLKQQMDPDNLFFWAFAPPLTQGDTP